MPTSNPGDASKLGAIVDAMFEIVADGAFLVDARGTLLKFNTTCERLFGYAPGEALGRGLLQLIPAPFADPEDRDLQGFQQKIVGIGREARGLRKDGAMFPLELSVAQAKHEGEAIFVGTVHDLTARRITEEQLIQAQKMEAIGQLSGGIAHDFNNLLTVIIGNAETLSDKLRVRPDLKQRADQVLLAGERGAQLTQRLLAFSRRQTLQPVAIDCNKLVEGMGILLRRTLREDIEISTGLTPDLLPAFADPTQLESAILNLTLNAQDAMPNGGRLTLSTADAALDEHNDRQNPEVKPGDYVMISVTDDGDGMTPDVLEHAFEPFFTTKEVGKGSGLGLSMVYGFVKQSDGHVGIYSEPGLGTTVRIYLPAMARDGVKLVRERVMDRGLPGGGESVLLAEDDPFVRGYAVTCLESLGYHVITAADGREALVHLGKELKIDLLFTDIVMPGGISGWDLAEQALKLRPGLKVLLTSGYPLETLAARGRHRANSNILNKPYRKGELAKRLRETLDSEPAD